MSAREAILASVRRALDGADQTAPFVPRGYREPAAPGDVLDLFVERVEDYRATVVRCPLDGVPAAVAEAVGQRSCLVPDGFGWDLAGALAHPVSDTGQTASELDRIDAVVTGATAGIAITGTIILDHGPGQGRRALTLVPDLHVCIVRADQVVSGVPDAVSRLDPTRPQTWISGPSATSDIELSRVEGVHGPRTLYVVLAG